MTRILFIASHRLNRSPSQRYRFEQYFDYLHSQGFECKLCPIISAEDDKWFYSEGNFFRKAFILFKSLLQRRKDLQEIKSSDIVFVQREALMIGSLWFEKRIKKRGAKFVFDFDDSIWLLDTSDGNKKYEWLKNPGKTAENIRMADLIFAGNAYLADYARQFNSNTIIVPTTIDTDFHKPLSGSKDESVITIGWSGSKTTIKHFHNATPFLKKLKEKYAGRLKFVVMGDESYINEELEIKGIAWTHETEVSIINSFDIGIMPLPADEWAKGKCGLKGLSYMACGVATVMSPVGVNNTIIEHGTNGLLASTDEEWTHALTELIENKHLRETLSRNARQTVLQKYSVEANKHLYNESLQKLSRGEY